jgi:hypothetical protein
LRAHVSLLLFAQKYLSVFGDTQLLSIYSNLLS